ncbi:hypothetical protein Pmani_032006 [Petrolisthes manimaculis]|uniref:Uncharacterized protein n=1 Tax=Petrolisthes manimaculis TaxID=1843537 RepID=A0AAE1NTX3_9EUCA|nr:hypothetical protein Pmani_032006 [Petrolisthes manimaculis]
MGKVEREYQRMIRADYIPSHLLIKSVLRRDGMVKLQEHEGKAKEEKQHEGKTKEEQQHRRKGKEKEEEGTTSTSSSTTSNREQQQLEKENEIGTLKEEIAAETEMVKMVAYVSCTATPFIIRDKGWDAKNSDKEALRRLEKRIIRHLVIGYLQAEVERAKEATKGRLLKDPKEVKEFRQFVMV